MKECARLFELKHLPASPHWEETDILSEPGLKAIFYDSIPYRGKPTKVFAWLGIPEKKQRAGTRPAVVLVHGGLGTAYPNWVRTWVERGYVAIAMDNCGAYPDETKKLLGSNDWPPHLFAGPSAGTKTSSITEKTTDQWGYHAVASVILAHSLLRSLPQVDAAEIGLTGVSWGAVLSCIAAGVDHRFRWVAPVYGCGHLDTPGGIIDNAQLPDLLKKKWLKRYDPGHYLSHAPMPFLFLTGTNDFAFPLPAVEQSIEDIPAACLRSYQVNLPHMHGDVSEKAPEIAAFAEAVRNNSEPPFAATRPKLRRGELSTNFRSAEPIIQADLVYTRATGYSSDRVWNTLPAGMEDDKRAFIPLPHRAADVFFNFKDKEGRTYSSPILQIPGEEK